MKTFNIKLSRRYQLISFVLINALSSNHAFTPFGVPTILNSDPITPFRLLESAEYFHPEVSNSADRLSMNLISLSHTALDIGLSVVSPEETFFIRFLGIIGRSIGLFTRYSSSQGIMEEELILQSATILISVVLLFKSLFPLAKALVHSISNKTNDHYRDSNAYNALFEPIGLSWLQYNALYANDILEWIDLGPSEEILLSNSKERSSEIKTNFRFLLKKALEKDIYWLHGGSIEVLFDRKYGRKIEKLDNFDLTSNDNISDIIFASNVFWTKCNTTNDSITFAPEKLIKGGSSGAELLKINSEKLCSLMEDDVKLASCIETLFFIGACSELSHLSPESHDCYIDQDALENECKTFL